VLAIALVGILAGLPSLPEPFGVDQGIYGYIGERILEGAVDYRDVFDHKPPGIHYAYAAAFALFGHKMSSVRLLDLLAAIATAWCLYALGRRWGGSRLGLICALLYPVFYQAFFDWMSRGQPETWVNLTFLAALVLLSRNSPLRAQRLLAAGLLLGAGFWFKPTLLPLALVCVALPAIRSTGEDASQEVGAPSRWRRFEINLLLVLLGSLAVCILVIAVFAARGALRDFYEAVFVFNARYHNRFRLVSGWRQAGSALAFILRPLYALTFLSVLTMALAAAPRTLLRNPHSSLSTVRRPRPAVLAFVWLLLAFATVFWQGSFQRSHYVLVLPPLVLLASLGLDGAIGAASALWQDERRRMMPVAVVALGFCLIAVNLVGLSSDHWTKFLALAGRRLSLDKYYAAFWLKGAPGRGGYSFEDLRQMGAYLEAQTSPDQTVFIWGFRPIIAWLAHRRMPTRFIFRYPLTRTNNPRWWNQFLSDLDRSPPAFFVVACDDRGLYHPETSEEALESNGALSLFLHGRYDLDRTMTDFTIYRLRRAAPP